MKRLSRPSHAWDSIDYQRITGASYHAGELIVDFADRTRARAAAANLLPPSTADPDWDGMVVDTYEIGVPTAHDRFELPWSAIRLATDPAYAAHLHTMAVEQARFIGSRIRELRVNLGLAEGELAQRAGVPAAALAAIEAGQVDLGGPPLEPILAAMGASFRDLIVNRPNAVSPVPVVPATG